MTRDFINQSRGISQAEQQLYDHFLELVQIEPPESLIDRFRDLFITGTRYPNAIIQAGLDQLIRSTPEPQFRFILNRCCHILINRWQVRAQHHGAIAQLVALFDSSPLLLETARSRTLKPLIHSFRRSEQYLMLKRLATVIAQPSVVDSGAQPLGTLICRYPYLYEHCLVSEGTPQAQQTSIRQLQQNRQRQFEVNLSQYVTYQIRCTASQRVIHPVQNPTLLDEASLRVALGQFSGKIQGNSTCRDRAQQFLQHAHRVRSYRDFKLDLYDYLSEAIDPSYGKRHFNHQITTLLENAFTDSDAAPMSDFLMMRTCSRLLNFLVIDNLQRPQHFVFVDLLSNLGATSTTRLLLQIVLLCRRMKPYLEKRFSILFYHYENHRRDGVQWLIAALENLHVAFSTNFSTIDLCFVDQLARSSSQRCLNRPILC